jgi:hypothetical protein
MMRRFSEINPPGTDACCEGAGSCVFGKALLARAVVCECCARRTLGERDVIDCTLPVARTNCSTLAALLRERARFVLRLPGAGQPIMHIQALRLQCGGLLAMQQVLEAQEPDVHRMVAAAHERFGSLTELPWEALVSGLATWQARRPSRPAAR